MSADNQAAQGGASLDVEFVREAAARQAKDANMIVSLCNAVMDLTAQNDALKIQNDVLKKNPSPSPKQEKQP